MSERNGAARVVAALIVVTLVGVAGWGSWRNRQARTDGVAPPVAATRLARSAPAPIVDRVDPVASLPTGCWSQTGVATTPDAEVATRISLRYCLRPDSVSTMTLSQGDRPRCTAAVVAQPLGARVRIAMADVPDCAFGTALPLFDALCAPPDDALMTCDIDWGGGLVETFRLRRS